MSFQQYLNTGSWPAECMVWKHRKEHIRYVLPHLLLLTLQWKPYYHCPHFIDTETTQGMFHIPSFRKIQGYKHRFKDIKTVHSPQPSPIWLPGVMIFRKTYTHGKSWQSSNLHFEAYLTVMGPSDNPKSKRYAISNCTEAIHSHCHLSCMSPWACAIVHIKSHDFPPHPHPLFAPTPGTLPFQKPSYISLISICHLVISESMWTNI